MTTLQQLESLVRAIEILHKAKIQTATVRPVWAKVSNAQASLEAQLASLISDPEVAQ
jgi:hypothetical protein